MIIAILLLLLCYLKLDYLSDLQRKMLEISALTLGTFAATLVGVYISISYDKEKEIKRAEEESKKILIASLKIIYSELDLNSISLRHIVDGLQNMPFILPRLYDMYQFVIIAAKPLKAEAFYSIIGSNALHEITQDNDIFNAIQQAYYNMKRFVDGLDLSRETYKDVMDKQEKNIPLELVERLRLIHDKEIEVAIRAQKLVNKAMDVIRDYLMANGVIFSIDEDIKNGTI